MGFIKDMHYKNILCKINLQHDSRDAENKILTVL